MAIIRNEKFNPAGVVVSAEQIDTVAQTFRQETNGVLGAPRALTAAEIAVYVTAPQEQANQSAIQTNLQQDQIAIQAIIDTPNATINANPAAVIKDIARNLKRLNRTALKDFTGTT